MTPEGYAAIAGATVLVLGAIFKFALDWKKSKDERDQASERLLVLRDIADTNRSIKEGQIAQNGKLSNIMKLNDDRHEEMIRTLNASCKARPMFQQIEQTKHEN